MEPKLNPALEQWFTNVLSRLDRHPKTRPRPFGTYYEFGVGWGGSLTTYFSALEKYCKSTGKSIDDFLVYCFDSFSGLPASDHHADKFPTWREGDFANSIEVIRERLSRNPFSAGFQNMHFVEGFFDKSLTKELQQKLAATPPQIITIDVDFYTSTKQVLDWLQPILMSGTYIYFDDIWAFHGHPDKGQLKAISEFNSRGAGHLTPFPQAGLPSMAYLYARAEFEY
jgi:hypothetical protein